MHEEIKLDIMNYNKFPPQLRMLLVGSSQVGKTSFIKKCLQFKSQLFCQLPSKIYYISPNLLESHLLHENDFTEELKLLANPIPIEFADSIPEVSEILEYVQHPKDKILIILDDFSASLYDSKPVSELYLRLSSKFGCDIISTSHVAFGQGKYYKLITNNTNYLCLFPCLSDRSMATFMQKKCFPGQPGFIQKVFEQVFTYFGPYMPIVMDWNIGNPLNHRFPIKTCVVPYFNEVGDLVHQPVYFSYKDITK